MTEPAKPHAKRKPPKDLPLGIEAWAVATELCMEGFCRCRQKGAPCLKAQHMAVCAMAAIEAAGYRTCDGCCHEYCGYSDED